MKLRPIVRCSRLILSAALICIFNTSSRAEFQQPRIIIPIDQSFVEESTISLVFHKGDVPADAVGISINGNRLPPILDLKERKIFCIGGAKLAEGPNRIRLYLLNNGEIVEEKIASVFFRSDLFRNAVIPPPGFEKYYFHTMNHEAYCSFCHQMPSGHEAPNPAVPLDSSCFPCHTEGKSSKYVHGPVSVGSCLMCHEQKSASSKYRIEDSDEITCGTCHEESVESWKKAGYYHGPVAMGRCTTCHDPHGSEYPFFLKMETTDLCSACHAETASRPHVILSYAGKGHPIRIEKDPFHPGQKFDCASCHFPHGSPYNLLLKEDPTSMASYCTTCHKKKGRNTR